MPPRQRQVGLPTILGIIVVILVALTLGILKPLQSIVGFTLKPITNLFNGGESQAQRENDELRVKISSLEAEVARLEEARQLNDVLRAQLNFAQANNFKLTQANIISQDPSNYQQFFTIDRGSTSGISTGMAVVSGSYLVGKIIDTTPTTAKVYLITDFNSAVPSYTLQTRASGIVRGQRGFGLSLESVPQTDTLQNDDTVLTSGFGGEYPRGLLIGTIGDVKKRDADVYQSALVRPSVDFRKLESVFIITGNAT